MTARDLAAACGFSVSTARRVLNGERALTCCEIARMATSSEDPWGSALESALHGVHELDRVEPDSAREIV